MLQTRESNFGKKALLMVLHRYKRKNYVKLNFTFLLSISFLCSDFMNMALKLTYAISRKCLVLHLVDLKIFFVVFQDKIYSGTGSPYMLN